MSYKNFYDIENRRAVTITSSSDIIRCQALYESLKKEIQHVFNDLQRNPSNSLQNYLACLMFQLTHTFQHIAVGDRDIKMLNEKYEIALSGKNPNWVLMDVFNKSLDMNFKETEYATSYQKSLYEGLMPY